MGAWTQVEEAPAGRMPWAAGHWTTRRGTPLHGVWRRGRPDGTATLLVANHGHPLIGWVVPDHDWAFTHERVRASNCALAQVPWVWERDGRLVASDPMDVAIGLVLAGRKPAALADTNDPAVATRWEKAARDAGLAVRSGEWKLDHGPVATTHWFVEVAVTDLVEELFDLDTLLEDYRACLPADAFADVERTLCRDAGEPVADLAADPNLIVALTPGQYARTGLVLGYHPATTAGIIRGAPRISWAADEASAVTINVLARGATPVPLPGLPSALLATEAAR